MSSKMLDERIVQMQFDNKSFEKNVQTSMGTLDKLKKSLNFDSAIKGLQDLTAASAQLTFDGLSNSVGTLTNKFSAWEIAAYTAISRLTNKVIDFGVNMTKSLSIDQITAGWEKYAEKTSSVQTIMSATTSTWEENAKAIGFEGTQMEYVSDQLEKLNWFSDETSFSFTDMTSNIGKFTSAGVALTDSVTAMEGISVWAAKSGQTAQSASRAYYNLAQALSVGSVKLMDWRSIENANMATMEFKQTAIETAQELKYLKKQSDGTWKTVDGNVVTVENFNEALSDGWFSSEVLLKTLEKYGKATTKLSEIYDTYKINATEFLQAMDDYNTGNMSLEDISEELEVSVENLLPLFEELNKDEYKLGLSAFKAAQEAKTFQEAIDATKDAVSTGWMKTFELIFGNYEEAKEFFTELSIRLWDIFAAGGQVRNRILSIWRKDEGGGREVLIESFWKLWDAIDSVKQVIHEAFGEIFPLDEKSAAAKLVAFTKNFKNFVDKLQMSEETADKLKRIFKGIFSLLDILKQSLSVVTIPIKALIGYLSQGKDTILDYGASIGDWLVHLNEFLKKSKTFEKVGTMIADIVLSIAKGIIEFKDGFISALGNGNTAMEKTLSVMEFLLNSFVYAILQTFSKLTGIDVETLITDIQEGISNFVDKFKTFASDLKDTFKDVTEKFVKFIKNLKDNFLEFAKIDTSGLKKFVDTIKSNFHPILSLMDGIKFIFNGLVTFFKNLTPLFTQIAQLLGKAFGGVVDIIKGILYDSNYEGLENLIKSGFLVTVGGAITGFFTKLSGVASSTKDIVGGIKGVINGATECFSQMQNNLKSTVLLKLAGAIGIISASLFLLSTIDQDKITGALAAITTEFIELMYAMNTMKGLTFGNSIATTLIGLAAAILIMALACKSLSSLSMDQVLQGVAGIAAMSFILTKLASSFMIVDKKQTLKMAKGIGSLILLAVAIRLLVKPLKELGTMDFENLVQGLAGIFVLISTVGAFMQKTANIKGSVKAGLMMIGMATAMLILSKAIQSFATMNYEEMLKGIAAFTISLAVMTEMMSNLSGVKSMISAGIGMTIMAAAMLIVAKALKSFAEMSYSEMLKGLISFNLSLGMMVAAFVALGDTKGMILKATGLVIMAAAMVIMANALKKFGDMNIAEIAKGLVALGGSLAILVVAANLMRGTLLASAAMLVMAAAINLLVVALKAMGNMSWGQIVKGLVTLAASIAVIGVAGLVLSTIAPLMLAAGAAMLVFGAAMVVCGIGASALAVGLTALSGAGVVGIEMLGLAIKKIIELIPDIIVTIVQSLVHAFSAFADMIDEFTKALAKIIIAIVETILDTLEKLTPKIVRFLTYTLTELVKGLIVAGRNLLPQLLDFILFVLQEIARVAFDYMQTMVTIGIEAFLGIVEGLKNELPKVTESLASLIVTLVNSLADAIDNNAEPLRDAFYNLFSSAWAAVLTFFGVDKDKAKKLIDTAITLITSFINGIVEMGTDLLNGFKEIFVTVFEFFDGLIEKFFNFGKNIIQGLIDGIVAMGDMAVDTVKGIGKGIADGFTGFFGIKSPSKLMESYGKYIDMGLIKGINGYSGKVNDASDDLAKDLISSFRDPLDMLNDEDHTFTITPLLDATKLRSQMDSIDGFEHGSMVRLADFNSRMLNDNLAARNQEVETGMTNRDIVGAISQLRQDTQALGDYISGMSVTLDGTKLVGGILPRVNNGLGRMVTYAGRGN